jgi:hypothetical protein
LTKCHWEECIELSIFCGERSLGMLGDGVWDCGLLELVIGFGVVEKTCVCLFLL